MGEKPTTLSVKEKREIMTSCHPHVKSAIIKQMCSNEVITHRELFNKYNDNNTNG